MSSILLQFVCILSVPSVIYIEGPVSVSCVFIFSCQAVNNVRSAQPANLFRWNCCLDRRPQLLISVGMLCVVFDRIIHLSFGLVSSIGTRF
jgi:hypothetical protein